MFDLNGIDVVVDNVVDNVVDEAARWDDRPGTRPARPVDTPAGSTESIVWTCCRDVGLENVQTRPCEEDDECACMRLLNTRFIGNCIATPSAISYSHHLLPKLTLPLDSDVFGQAMGSSGANDDDDDEGPRSSATRNLQVD